jgi:nucleotide-binding universal stress UspA family protein
MPKVLVPISGSRNCHLAVRHVIGQFTAGKAMDVHLLNVQPQYHSHIGRFVSRRNLRNFQLTQAANALGPVKKMLDGFSIPYSAHIEIGDKAEAITDTARRLHCDRIVMSTVRKDALIRLVEDSVTNKVLALTSVPVEVIAGEPMTVWERYGIPAGIGTILTLILLAVDD